MSLPELTAERAAASPHAHEFAALDRGHVHYELSGPTSGQTIVLVHGLTSPMFVWDRIVDGLRARSHRVLRYDLYGRGLSARPRVAYEPQLFQAQLRDLLARLEIDQPVTLVGFSWGCGVAARFAVMAPGQVRRLVLLAPGGLPGARYDGSMTMLRTPGLGELITATVGLRGLRRDVRRCFVAPERQGWFGDRFEEQLAYDGYARAFLSTLRSFPATLEEVYGDLGRSEVPTRVLWGTRDAKVPFEGHRRFMELVPGAELVELGPVGHAAQIEAPEAFVEAVLRG